MIARQRCYRIGGLAGLIALLSIIWLVVLPAYARQPEMRQHLKWLDDRGIDPSAMYYTELDVMDDILAKHRLAELRQESNRPNR
ncbi:putative signal peptide and transmembrane protein [Rhodopirellula islandica]|uniref:Signal peptide and transmembrane protein n=1 Tax=Rhodopirellula islandica TaxID=595434 RepID=A0A0J1E9C6_RHOIS|nr:hypothetical protein [Rhodopirellula islandica]KLU02094.1 putative signal peptide and transmembrane protein [Rhodopirellula islandica]